MGASQHGPAVAVKVELRLYFLFCFFFSSQAEEGGGEGVKTKKSHGQETCSCTSCLPRPCLRHQRRNRGRIHPLYTSTAPLPSSLLLCSLSIPHFLPFSAMSLFGKLNSQGSAQLRSQSVAVSGSNTQTEMVRPSPRHSPKKLPG